MVKISTQPFTSLPPYKSVAGALLLSAFFGPVGLLYASFWGGFTMIAVGFVVVSSKLFYPIALFWVICCIWSVGAVESYNKKILRAAQQQTAFQ
ncbi:hypothetical protein [Aquicella lusitana]|uniref:Uncharacterized protein n=1 Tax=Aquicella lusitana TaxID=254246 RepID=A0A370GMF7_9COXI|nr:hypothetical protein [Aquicella lusitana]RDI44837.1 hypothetical protein C8D86_10891 [Aquicella lusitana]VVC73034.1 hypothetical protein AQULUS_07620 [Aquicella lusitana]